MADRATVDVDEALGLVDANAAAAEPCCAVSKVGQVGGGEIDVESLGLHMEAVHGSSHEPICAWGAVAGKDSELRQAYLLADLPKDVKNTLVEEASIAGAGVSEHHLQVLERHRIIAMTIEVGS
jgi:hypothetical protein